MILLIDNYDSFTYMLRDYVAQAGEECMVVRNDEMSLAQIKDLDFDSIIISPGPKSPAAAGITIEVIAAFHTYKPILGICLGHQAIGQFFGAELVTAQTPMHGKTSTVSLTAHPIFTGIPPQIDVMRYHSLILKDLLGEKLEPIALTGDGEIMAISHTSLKIAGLQFHPESILTQYGSQMIKNWVLHISN